MGVCTYGAKATTCVLAIVMCSSTSCNAEEAPTRPRRRALVWGSQGFYVDTFGTNADPPRYLYPEQKELEGMLTGDPESRRPYAALLPLRLACDPRNGFLRPSPAYQRDVLRAIVREKWKEALPLLAYGMQETAPEAFWLRRRVFDLGWEHNAAAVWLWLATQDMDKDAELEFILRILKGEEPSVEPGMIKTLADAIDRETLRVILSGRRIYKLRDSLLAFLTGTESALTTTADLDRAVLIGRLLGKYVLPTQYLQEIESYLVRVSERPSAFNQVVVIRATYHLETPGDHPGIISGPGIRSDKLRDLDLKACEILWRCKLNDPELARRVRDMVLSGPLGVEKMFTYLKELNDSREPYAGMDMIAHILERLEASHERAPLPAEIITYLRGMAADPRYGAAAMAMKPEENLAHHIEEVKNIYRTYTRARTFIDRILEPRDDK